MGNLKTFNMNVKALHGKNLIAINSGSNYFIWCKD